AGGPGPVGRTARRAWTARGLLGVRLAVARVAPRPTGPARPHGPGRGGPRGDGGDHVRQGDPVGEARLEVPDLEPLPGPPRAARGQAEPPGDPRCPGHRPARPLLARRLHAART